MRDEDEMLIQHVLEGSVEGEAFDRFQERLRHEPELLKTYRDYALLNHQLGEVVEHQQLLREATDGPEEEESTQTRALVNPFIPDRTDSSKAAQKSPSPRWRWAGLAVAACVGGALAVKFWPKGKIDKVTPSLSPAIVTLSPDTVFHSTPGLAVAGRLGTLEPGARIQLDAGHARVEFASGTSVFLRGPALLTYEDEKSLSLESGRGCFRLGDRAQGLVVKTSQVVVSDLGTQFAVWATDEKPDEVHVFEGKVSVNSPSQPSNQRTLTANQSISVDTAGHFVDGAANRSAFSFKMPEEKLIVSDWFKDTEETPLAKHRPIQSAVGWQITEGQPVIHEGRMEATGFQAFLPLPSGSIGPDHPIVLATLETSASSSGAFHTGGWAGMSLYIGESEAVFFGDSFGEKKTWSLDIKRQGLHPIRPSSPITGPRTVTLRYNWRTGEASLHEGLGSLSPAFVKTQMPAQLTFDRLRLSSSPKAILCVRSISVMSVSDAEAP